MKKIKPIWLIAHKVEPDWYWDEIDKDVSRETGMDSGWNSKSVATRYTEEDKECTKLPPDGTWERLV